MDKIAANICKKIFHDLPDKINRCMVGQGNYVFVIRYATEKYVIRINNADNHYDNTIYWLKTLNEINVPVPEIIDCGKYDVYNYIILTYIEGRDIGDIYLDLSDKEKLQIATKIVKIQNDVGNIKLDNIPQDWKWIDFVNEMLARAGKRISQNGYFDIGKVQRLHTAKNEMLKYFSQIKPIPYLDDVSTKNLLIDNGQISGIIDVDWIGIGDKLTFVALTYVALLNMCYDTDYIEYILQEMSLTATEQKAFIFYSLMFCVDFMGERGTRFTDKVVEVNETIITRLNDIYDFLWDKWSNG